MVIEVQGCFWHKHKCVEPEDGWAPEDKLVQSRDSGRSSFLKSQGYVVIEIWECDITKRPEKVQARLKKLAA